MDSTTRTTSRRPRPRPVSDPDPTIKLRRERFLDAMTDTLVRLRLRQIAGAKGLALFTGQSAHAPGPEGPEGEVDGE
jgi:hypothetical protein